LFRKGDKGDCAYLIMHGKVLFLTLAQLTWHGKQPNDKLQSEINSAQFVRYLNTGAENVTCVETENIVVEFQTGKLFGEIALLDPSKATRALSAMTKIDSIFLILNMEAFDIIVKDKLKRDREEMGKFVHTSIPKLKDYFSLFSVISNVHVLFKESSYVKGQWVIIEGQKCEKLYIIKKGYCGIFKNVERKDEIGNVHVVS
jgi:CRP-like cAMP-binding protein